MPGDGLILSMGSICRGSTRPRAISTCNVESKNDAIDVFPSSVAEIFTQPQKSVVEFLIIRKVTKRTLDTPAKYVSVEYNIASAPPQQEQLPQPAPIDRKYRESSEETSAELTKHAGGAPKALLITGT